MPGTHSLTRIRIAFELSLISDAESCRKRWEKLYEVLLAWKFPTAKAIVLSWRDSNIITEDGAQDIIRKIDALIEARPDVIV